MASGVVPEGIEKREIKRDEWEVIARLAARYPDLSAAEEELGAGAAVRAERDELRSRLEELARPKPAPPDPVRQVLGSASIQELIELHEKGHLSRAELRHFLGVTSDIEELEDEVGALRRWGHMVPRVGWALCWRPVLVGAGWVGLWMLPWGVEAALLAVLGVWGLGGLIGGLWRRPGLLGSLYRLSLLVLAGAAVARLESLALGATLLAAVLALAAADGFWALVGGERGDV